MRTIFLASILLPTLALAAENKTIQTDIKLLCGIKKIEKNLSKDSKEDQAELAVRFYRMKDAAIQDKATKEALKAISTMEDSEKQKAWKEFAKQNNADGSCL